MESKGQLYRTVALMDLSQWNTFSGLLSGIGHWGIYRALSLAPSHFKYPLVVFDLSVTMLRGWDRQLVGALGVIATVMANTPAISDSWPSLFVIIKLMALYLTKPATLYLRFQESSAEIISRLAVGLIALASFTGAYLSMAVSNIIVRNFNRDSATICVSAFLVAYCLLLLLSFSPQFRGRPPGIILLVLLGVGFDLLFKFISAVLCVTYGSIQDFMRSLEAWEARKANKVGSTMPRYVYPTLDENIREFRILRLYRRTLCAELKCSLIQLSIDQAPPFEAISYTWGGEEPTAGIVVDGCWLPVTPTVSKWLWYRRSFFSEAYFWIDAVCIDQQNNCEKSSQIRLMRDIYQRASRTLVWLAHPSEARNSIAALGFIMAMAPLSALEECFGQLPMGQLIYIDMPTVVPAMSRSYFHRVWIVQEVALARKVHIMYGDVIMDWDTFYQASKAMLMMARTGTMNVTSEDIVQMAFADTSRNMVTINTINTIREQCRACHHFSLREVLEKLRGFEATKPHDAIFGFLGIIRDESSDRFLACPSYKEPVQCLFTRTARYLMRQDESLSLIQFAGSGYPRQVGHLPSWVPDWSSPVWPHRKVSSRGSAEDCDVSMA